MKNQASLSKSEHVTLPCRGCGRPLEIEVWIVVDTAERPDLLARLRDGSLHVACCPDCGHEAKVNAPLLVYRPGAEPALLFSPARGGTPEQDEEQATALLGMFREDMGDQWRDEWLGRGLTGVPHEALHVLMRDDPATAAAFAAAHAAEESDVPPGLRQTLEEIVLALATEGVRVNTAEDLQAALETRPALKERLRVALSGGLN